MAFPQTYVQGYRDLIRDIQGIDFGLDRALKGIKTHSGETVSMPNRGRRFIQTGHDGIAAVPTIAQRNWQRLMHEVMLKKKIDEELRRRGRVFHRGMYKRRGALKWRHRKGRRLSYWRSWH